MDRGDRGDKRPALPNDMPKQVSSEEGLPERELSEMISQVRARTPARLLAGRAGAAYRTNTQLDLREAHAAARDAVRAELIFFGADGFASKKDEVGSELVRRYGLFEVSSQATGKDEYLLRPDLGRHLNIASRAELTQRCTRNNDLQIVIGDGLSVTAVVAQVPPLLPLLYEGAETRGWSLGQPFVIRYCRVGILNEIGELLAPKVVVLLIGERPGLATAESLSAYMAYQPKLSDTDAHRNLISNIHARGVSTAQAVQRILNLAAAMMKARQSGCQLREQLPTLDDAKGTILA